MKFDKTFAVMIILFISIMTISGVIAFNRTNQTQQFNPDITTTLQVTVSHNGHNTTRIVHDDLIQDNFNLWLQGLLSNYAQTSLSESMTSTAGVLRSVYFAGNTQQFNSQSNNGGYIYLGTGTKSATRTAISMQTLYGSAFTDASSVCNSGSPDTVVVQGSVSAGSTAMITEAGFALQLYVTSIGPQIFLFTYETFSAVSVTNGDTISVQYTFNLNNAGVNRNFCNALATLFLYTTSNSVWNAYATDGVSYPMCGWNSGVCQYNTVHAQWFEFAASTNIANGAGTYDCTDASVLNNMNIWMGTGSTTFGFTTSGLTSPVGATPTVASATTFTTGLATSFIFITENTFNPASTITATETGLFSARQITTYTNSACNTSPVTATKYFLWFGFTISVSMPSGQNNPMTFQISD